jgi:hypothetical protein
MKPRITCYLISTALSIVLPFLVKRPLRPCSPDEQAQQLTEIFAYQQEAPGWLSTPLTSHCSTGSMHWSDVPAALRLMWRPLTFAVFVGVLAVAFLGELLFGVWLLILSRSQLKGAQSV